jgi:excinuclease ABC subunit A
MGSELTGVLYILDEPSIGLHPRDNRRLLDARALARHRQHRARGRTRPRDHGAVRLAGRLRPGGGAARRRDRGQRSPQAGQGWPQHSLTGRICRGAQHRVARGAAHARTDSADQMRNARANNLRGSTPHSPWGCSPASPACRRRQEHTGQRSCYRRPRARSTAPSEVGAPRRPHRTRTPRQGHRHRPEPHRPHTAQQPGDVHQDLGRHPRGLRRDPEAKPTGTTRAASASTSRAGAARPARATASRRSRCTSWPTSTCLARCARAGGSTRRRCGRLQRDGTIADVLETPSTSRASCSNHHPKIKRALEDARRTSASATSLSGSPRPRCRGGRRSASNCRASWLQAATGRTLYILDEPTTGLHFEDIRKLLGVVNGWSTPAIRW